MGIRYKGAGAKEVRQQIIRDASEMVIAARKVFLAGGVFIMQESIKNAPVDKHNLEAAHEMFVEVTSSNFVVSINVGGMVGGVNVDQYAWIMHDNPNYALGRKSQAKNSSRNKVGPMFLDRAVQKNIDGIYEKMKQAVARA